jgi:hypothetical protein
LVGFGLLIGLHGCSLLLASLWCADLGLFVFVVSEDVLLGILLYMFVPLVRNNGDLKNGHDLLCPGEKWREFSNFLRIFPNNPAGKNVPKE